MPQSRQEPPFGFAFAQEGSDIFLTYLLASLQGRTLGFVPAKSEMAEEPGPEYYDKILTQDAGAVIRSIHALVSRCEAWEADLADPGQYFPPDG